MNFYHNLKQILKYHVQGLFFQIPQVGALARILNINDQ
jgi:hypothetical protein